MGCGSETHRHRQDLFHRRSAGSGTWSDHVATSAGCWPCQPDGMVADEQTESRDGGRHRGGGERGGRCRGDAEPAGEAQRGVAGDVARPGRDLQRLRQAQRRPRGDPDRRRRALLRRRRHLGILQGARQRGGRPQLRCGGSGGDAGHHRSAAADDRRGAWLRRWRWLRTGAGMRPARGRRDDADGHPGRAAVHRLRLAGLQPAAARRRVGERQAGACTRDAISRWPTAGRWA